MSALTSTQVRKAFLDFFQSKGHEVVASAPLIPQNDPTLMFTVAGMVQFKDVFTGKETRPYKRATSSQKCMRISGKQNDLENVGVTARHHTFFEMLGNFSFADYFKEDAIAYAWELLTKVYALPKDRLIISVFGGDPADKSLAPDDEARAIWKKVTGFGDDRIIGLGMKDNFWQAGDTGPCGPCTEIHYYLGDKPDYTTLADEPLPDGRGWMEIWNLVFMQFERSIVDGAAKLGKLPKPCVDTGAGLERLSIVLQGKTSSYDTDLLRGLVEKAAEIAGKPYGGTQSDDDVSMRVIADHARTTAFLIAEGISPDKDGRPYVLRRVMRRAIRHGHRLGITRPFLHEVALEVVRTMGGHYPELEQYKASIASTAEQEEVRFRETIDRGLDLLDKNAVWRSNGDRKILPGDIAHKLSSTFGFPLDLTQVIGRERGFEVDLAGYELAEEEHKKNSGGGQAGDDAIADVWRAPLEKLPAGGVRFTGYEREDGEAKVVAIVKNGALVERAAIGDEVAIITDVTPFYGEAGGQVGDKGRIRNSAGLSLTVADTQKPLTGIIAHHGKIEAGAVAVGDAVQLEVDHALRSATRRNHSATHLLHWALRTVLGEQATQKGSLVGPDRLRFDYAYGRALTQEEIARIEDLVNTKVLGNAAVTTDVLPAAEARARGAMAIFEEKYGDIVRVLTMTPDSVELCGGTHAAALGDIGLFKIMSEGGLAAGVRRIEAATGLNALRYVREVENTLRNAARAAKSGIQDLPEKLEKLLERDRQLEKEVADLNRKLAMGGSKGGGVEDMAKSARDIPGGGKALAVQIEVSDPATLREVAEKLRDKLGEGVVLVAAVAGGKVSLVVMASKGITARFKAGDMIKHVAQVVGGAGGGRPDMAQAGGPAIDKVDDALAAFYAKLGAY